MSNNNRFTTAELYKILECNYQIGYKIWKHSVSPLHTEIDYLNWIIPHYQERVEYWKNHNIRDLYNKLEFEIVELDMPIIWKKKLEIADHRFKELNKDIRPVINGYSNNKNENIRFKKWFDNLNTDFDSGKGYFLNKELELCRGYLARTAGNDVYTNELQEVLLNEYKIILETSERIYNENLAAAENYDAYLSSITLSEQSIQEGDIEVESKDFSESENIEVEEQENLLQQEDPIDSYFKTLKKHFQGNDYKVLYDLLFTYIQSGNLIAPQRKITVNGKPNKKEFGWALNQVFRKNKSGDLPEDYIRFMQENISLFTNDTVEIVEFKKSNLYKYFTTKPPKKK